MTPIAITAAHQQPQILDVRAQANEESDRMVDTIRRISPFILGLIATIISSVACGLIPAILAGAGVTLLAAAGANICCLISDLREHTHVPGYQIAPTIPWYRRIITWIPKAHFGSSEQRPHNAPGHIVIGEGHFREQAHGGRGRPASTSTPNHAHVDRSHRQQHPRSDAPPPPSRAQGHVEVGRGHAPTPTRSNGPPPSIRARDHIEVGRGHAPTPRRSDDPRPQQGGHVGVGKGHFH